MKPAGSFLSPPPEPSVLPKKKIMQALIQLFVMPIEDSYPSIL
jgi:hypothetical protein